MVRRVPVIILEVRVKVIGNLGKLVVGTEIIMKVRSLAVINLAPADDDLIVAVVPGPIRAVGTPITAVLGPIGPITKVIRPMAKAAIPMAKVATPVPAPIPPILP